MKSQTRMDADAALIELSQLTSALGIGSADPSTLADSLPAPRPPEPALAGHVTRPANTQEEAEVRSRRSPQGCSPHSSISPALAPSAAVSSTPLLKAGSALGGVTTRATLMHTFPTPPDPSRESRSSRTSISGIEIGAVPGGALTAEGSKALAKAMTALQERVQTLQAARDALERGNAELRRGADSFLRQVELRLANPRASGAACAVDGIVGGRELVTDPRMEAALAGIEQLRACVEAAEAAKGEAWAQVETLEKEVEAERRGTASLEQERWQQQARTNLAIGTSRSVPPMVPSHQPLRHAAHQPDPSHPRPIPSSPPPRRAVMCPTPSQTRTIPAFPIYSRRLDTRKRRPPHRCV